MESLNVSVQSSEHVSVDQDFIPPFENAAIQEWAMRNSCIPPENSRQPSVVGFENGIQETYESCGAVYNDILVQTSDNSAINCSNEYTSFDSSVFLVVDALHGQTTFLNSTTDLSASSQRNGSQHERLPNIPTEIEDSNQFFDESAVAAKQQIHKSDDISDKLDEILMKRRYPRPRFSTPRSTISLPSSCVEGGKKLFLRNTNESPSKFASPKMHEHKAMAKRDACARYDDHHFSFERRHTERFPFNELMQGCFMQNKGGKQDGEKNAQQPVHAAAPNQEPVTFTFKVPSNSVPKSKEELAEDVPEAKNKHSSRGSAIGNCNENTMNCKTTSCTPQHHAEQTEIRIENNSNNKGNPVGGKESLTKVCRKLLGRSFTYILPTLAACILFFCILFYIIR